MNLSEWDLATVVADLMIAAWGRDWNWGNT